MVAAVVAIVVALLGYIGTYATNLHLSRRNENLARINRQLGELYGPLLAYTESNSKLFKVWEGTLRSDGISPFDGTTEPTEEELAAWRLWMRTVFLPNVCKARDVVIEKADLLIESSMPPVLLELCVHVAAYEITIKQWDSRDGSGHAAIVRFPEGLDEYANSSFRTLKERQLQLPGRTARIGAYGAIPHRVRPNPLIDLHSGLENDANPRPRSLSDKKSGFSLPSLPRVWLRLRWLGDASFRNCEEI